MARSCAIHLYGAEPRAVDEHSGWCPVLMKHSIAYRFQGRQRYANLPPC